MIAQYRLMHVYWSCYKITVNFRHLILFSASSVYHKLISDIFAHNFDFVSEYYKPNVK